ncbi:MAG: SpoIIE family protein phosphatase, partial [Deltaproteobacteria bacterium]|nr:SpoIIE family protein phosphatase [Deltaproteobacteria bacterium]
DMTMAYRALYTKIPQLAIWQYTGLESGIISNYPGVEKFPRDFDPRKRLWYQNAKKTGALSWGEPYIDALSGGIILTVSQPVYQADGSFAGVTSIDFPFEAILGAVKLPGDWAKKAKILSVARDESESDQTRLKIIAQRSYQSLRQPWHSPVKIDFLHSDNPVELAALIRDAEAGRSGVKRMGYKQVDSFWAYGAAGLGKAFPVIIVPYDFIVAQATETKARVIETTINALHLTAAILVAVVVAVTALAFFGSRSVSLPIRRLAEAAVDLADGNYQAKVDIKTGGELKMLGEAFNAMGPRLKERERMQASLALAKKVQQYLLPSKVPEIKNFEIYGSCTFCEEVGGDYYDFFDSKDLAPGKIGIAVGDVSGHGVGAALLMATVRGGLLSQAGAHHNDLSTLFCHLNENLFKSSGQEQFMTLFFGVLDESDRSCSWASGGHGPCFWMQSGGQKIEELSTTGIPLGILEDAKYRSEGPIMLAPGDALIIGTDGLWEAQNTTGEMYGIQRFVELLSGCWGETAAEIHSSVLRAIGEFGESTSPVDDMTLVVVKVV